MPKRKSFQPPQQQSPPAVEMENFKISCENITMNNISSDALKAELESREKVLKIKEHLLFPVIQKLYAILKYHNKVHYATEEEFLIDMFKNPTKYEPILTGWFS